MRFVDYLRISPGDSSTYPVLATHQFYRRCSRHLRNQPIQTTSSAFNFAVPQSRKNSVRHTSLICLKRTCLVRDWSRQWDASRYWSLDQFWRFEKVGKKAQQPIRIETLIGGLQLQRDLRKRDCALNYSTIAWESHVPVHKMSD